MEKDFIVLSANTGDKGHSYDPSALLCGDGVSQQPEKELKSSLLWSYDSLHEAIAFSRGRITILQAKLEDVTDALFYESQSLRVNEATINQVAKELADAGVNVAGRRTDEHYSSNN
jgi:hypothetical protein